MNSDWTREILAVFAKEWREEARSRVGWFTAGLFALVSVVAAAFVFFGRDVNRPDSGFGEIIAGLLWITLLFSALLSLPRTFLAEEESGTADLLRRWARPHAVYWGKALYGLALCQVLGVAICGLYVMLLGVIVRDLPLLMISLFLGSACLAGTVTLCSALAARAENRAALAAAIAAPLLLPLMQAAVSVTRVAFGSGLVEGAWFAALALAGMAAATLAIGPYLYAAIWKS
jgi:heme exporter protein B